MSRSQIRFSTLAFALCALAAACSSDSSTSTANQGPATFTQVYGIISQRCAPCHTSAGQIGITMGHLDMTSKASAYANLVNADAAGVSCSGKGTRVVPGAEDDSIMYLKVSLDDPTPCGSKMPLGGPALSQDESDTIESWIHDGAKTD